MFLDIFHVFFSSRFFHIHFSLFHAAPSPPPVAGDMAMVFLDDSFLLLKAGSSFHLFFTHCAGLVALPFRGVGVSFEEPHLRLMF